MALESTRSTNRKQSNNSSRNNANGPTVFFGQSSDDTEIDGLELSAAAQILGVSVDDIWRQVRNGKLIARTERGQVLVYTDCEFISGLEGLPPLPSSSVTIEPIPTSASEEPQKAVRMEELYPSALVQSHQPSDRQEIALLIDHLSLAKEENREILRLTSESMSKLSEMTDRMLEMKDSIIASKEEQMQILKQRLAEQSSELRQALQQKEDLETLTEALQRV
jgi:hypothetical protein